MDGPREIEPVPDEQYVSEEDEDFNPTTVEAQDDDLSESSDDEEGVLSKTHNGSRKRKQIQAGVNEELDSGDEATIQEQKKKKKKRKTDQDQDSGGEGGLVKTRAQRKAEKQERAEFRTIDKGNVTIDVDSLWARLSGAPVGRRKLEPNASQDSLLMNRDRPEVNDEPVQPFAINPHDDNDDDMITIKRSYGFAGQTITEEKRVHKSSAEAKLHLANNKHTKDVVTKQPSPSAALDAKSGLQLRRPLRRASRFEPNPTGEVKALPLDRQRLRAPSRADVLALQERQDAEDKRKGKVQKLTTVQKSAIDWAAHVDREGLKEELDVYGRSKTGFLGRMEFMRGVEGRKEAEERTARLATSTAASAPPVSL